MQRFSTEAGWISAPRRAKKAVTFPADISDSLSPQRAPVRRDQVLCADSTALIAARCDVDEGTYPTSVSATNCEPGCGGARQPLPERMASSKPPMANIIAQHNARPTPGRAIRHRLVQRSTLQRSAGWVTQSNTRRVQGRKENGAVSPATRPGYRAR